MRLQRGRVLKSVVIVIDTVLVQNLLLPFGCVLGENILKHFSCLAVWARSSNSHLHIQYIY